MSSLLIMSLVFGSSQAFGPQNSPIEFTRDENFNRVVITGSASDSARTNQSQSQAGRSQASAVGNLINVTIHGSNNTVVVRSHQVNTGGQQSIVAVSPTSRTGGE